MEAGMSALRDHRPCRGNWPAANTNWTEEAAVSGLKYSGTVMIGMRAMRESSHEQPLKGNSRPD